MEKKIARLVNKGFEGEPQNIVFQELESLKIFNFSEIKFINENDSIREITFNDNDLDQTEIRYILNNGHEVSITWDEFDIATIYF